MDTSSSPDWILYTLQELKKIGLSSGIINKKKQEGFSETLKKVKFSTTAYTVNYPHYGCPEKWKLNANYFKYLRTDAIISRENWLTKLSEFNEAKYRNVSYKSSDIKVDDLEESLKKAENEYFSYLEKMANNGIWNCREFADFAVIFLRRGQVLVPSFFVEVVVLNDRHTPGCLAPNAAIPRVAAPVSYIAYERENHDHVFAVIYDSSMRSVDRECKKVAVVDLWTIFVNLYRKPCVDSIGSFIHKLNSNPDGWYVRPRNITENDFTIIRPTFI